MVTLDKHPLREPNNLYSYASPHPAAQRMCRNHAGSSSSINSATVSPQTEHVGIKCACGHDAVRRISKTKKNPDRPFYKCPEDGSRGCRVFLWEDEISGPGYQTGPRTQSQSSQTIMQTPARTSTASSSPLKTPWTTQTPSRPPMSQNSNKRKRSPSPSPTPSPSTTTIRGRDDVLASISLSFGPLETEANAFSRSVANPVASTSAGGGSDSAFPTKRARVDNANTAGSMFSDDEELWADAALDVAALPLDGKLRNHETSVSSAQPLKKSVSFQGLNDGGDENIDDEDGILVDTSILRLLDFKNKRGPSPDRLINLHVRDATMDNFPIVDDDPSNPFRTHKTPDKPSTTYTNGTSACTPGALPATSPLVSLSSVGHLSTNTSPVSANPMPTLLRLEELLPELVTALPAIAKQERMRVADEKSIEWKSQKIKALTEEVKRLKGEIASLKEENAQLRRV